MYELEVVALIALVTTASTAAWCRWKRRPLYVTKSTFVSDVLGTQVDITKSVKSLGWVGFDLLPEDITDIATDGRIVTSYLAYGRPYKLISYDDVVSLGRREDRKTSSLDITPECMKPDTGSVFVSVENGIVHVITDSIMEYAGPEKDFGACWTSNVVKIRLKDLVGDKDVFVLRAADAGVLVAEKMNGDTVIQASYS